jgi:hypothetical protein
MAANDEPLTELLAQMESIQDMLKAHLSDSEDVAELKLKMAFVWGNGKPGKLQQLEDSDEKQNQAMWYIKGALWVIIGLLASFVLPLTIFLLQMWLQGHR